MTLLQDIRYGLRMLAAGPGFTTVAVLSLAIGIGANCAIFSFADALLLRLLPVARPGEVLSVGSGSSLEALNASSLVSSYRDYIDIRDCNRSFDGLAAFSSHRAILSTCRIGRTRSSTCGRWKISITCARSGSSTFSSRPSAPWA